jgi:hypothetical protein
MCSISNSPQLQRLCVPHRVLSLNSILHWQLELSPPLQFTVDTALCMLAPPLQFTVDIALCILVPRQSYSCLYISTFYPQNDEFGLSLLHGICPTHSSTALFFSASADYVPRLLKHSNGTSAPLTVRCTTLSTEFVRFYKLRLKFLRVDRCSMQYSTRTADWQSAAGSYQQYMGLGTKSAPKPHALWLPLSQ